MDEPYLPEIRSDKVFKKGNANNYTNCNLLGKIKLSKEISKEMSNIDNIKPSLNKERPKFNLDFHSNNSIKEHEKLNFFLQNKVNHRRNYSEIIKQQNTEKIIRKKFLFENIKKEDSNNSESNDYPRNASRSTTSKLSRKHNQSIDILINNSRNKILIESSFSKDKNCLNTSNMSIKLFSSIEDNETSLYSNSKKVISDKKYTQNNHSNNLNVLRNATSELNGSRIENICAIEKSIENLKKKQNELKNKLKFQEYDFYKSLTKENCDFSEVSIFDQIFKKISNSLTFESCSNFTNNDQIKIDYLSRTDYKNEERRLIRDNNEHNNSQFKHNTNNKISLFNKKFKIVNKDLFLNNLSPSSQKFNFSTASTTSNNTKIFYNDNKFDTKHPDKNIKYDNKYKDFESNKNFNQKIEIKKKEQSGKKFSINDVEAANNDYFSKLLQSHTNNSIQQFEIDSKIQITICKNSKPDINNSSSKKNDLDSIYNMTDLKPSEINLSLNTCKDINLENEVFERHVCKIQKKFRMFLKYKKYIRNTPFVNNKYNKSISEINIDLVEDPKIILKSKYFPYDSEQKSRIVENANLFSIKDLAKSSCTPNSKLYINPLNEGNLLNSIKDDTINSSKNNENQKQITSSQYNRKTLNTLNNSQNNLSYMTFIKNEINYENSNNNDISINSYLANRSFVDENLLSDDISTKTINTRSIEDDDDFDY